MEETIDIFKLLKFILKRVWLVILCMVIGFGGMYYRAVYMQPDTYTAEATMYVYNGNPNVVNYQYTNSSDIDAAVKLIDAYKVVITGNAVLGSVAERLGNTIPIDAIAKTLTFNSVSGTGFLKVYSTAADPQTAMDICNAVMDIAPGEIVRVVSAGNVQVVDYAVLPASPNSKQGLRQGLLGAMVGAVLSGGLLLLLFFMNKRLSESRELTETYGLPLLSVIGKVHSKEKETHFLISKDSDVRRLSEFSKLRINLRAALKGDMKTVLVTSALPNEGKSTTAANLCISTAMTGKRVLLIDADMRKPAQCENFEIPKDHPGLSDILTGQALPGDVIITEIRPNLDMITAGAAVNNPSELLDSEQMKGFLKLTQIANGYELIVIDLPPINLVPDALALSESDVGLLFITRAGYSDHREIEKSLNAVKFANITILGMVMTCATGSSDKSYTYHYDGYYSAYNSHSKHRKKNIISRIFKSKKRHTQH